MYYIFLFLFLIVLHQNTDIKIRSSFKVPEKYCFLPCYCFRGKVWRSLDWAGQLVARTGQLVTRTGQLVAGDGQMVARPVQLVSRAVDCKWLELSRLKEVCWAGWIELLYRLYRLYRLYSFIEQLATTVHRTWSRGGSSNREVISWRWRNIKTWVC